MIVSRLCLAMMDAPAIDKDLLSPRTTGWLGQGMSFGNSGPSISAYAGPAKPASCSWLITPLAASAIAINVVCTTPH